MNPVRGAAVESASRLDTGQTHRARRVKAAPNLAASRPLAARAAKARVPGFLFAPALIAAKPVKPCDGGVFGALDLLLFLQ